jgi:hypothetical protein
MAAATDRMIFCNAALSLLEERSVNFFPVREPERVSEPAMGSGHA